ncbi:aldose 1-epimerase [Grosmannia clavigera kw1407]|uniref:Aldose 1-epimerase n=1 Tax=Grosmannia clavigera (strain kw1407 / UAMH 11150) TaxID=655863 RepID=F0XLA6_GROCL|nr:aldose 1-epimerase [Grosmannia clavigera kw1407]EFX01372.1 aldose 1-epimerase [Grosmannia clavigera kw1407]
MADDAPFSFLPLGAIIQRFDVDGTNIVQGFPTSELYASHNAPYFGETIGRVANRISGAQLHNINGSADCPLTANDGPNALHGGPAGWGKKTWTGPSPVGVHTLFPGLAPLTEGGESVRFTLDSPDGDEGYPGNVLASVTYTAGRQAEDDKRITVLVIDYEAELVGNADETVINMTNHSYFNLSGTTSIEGTVVELATNSYLPVDSTGIPTGGPVPFATVPPAHTSFVFGATAPDIDDCLVVNEEPSSVPIDTRSSPLVRFLTAHHPQSGVHLEVWSTEPAFQLYTAGYVDLPPLGGLPARGQRCGFCVEPSRYVNAANVDAWRSMVLLKRGAKYGARIVYRAWKDAQKEG